STSLVLLFTGLDFSSKYYTGILCVVRLLTEMQRWNSIYIVCLNISLSCNDCITLQGNSLMHAYATLRTFLEVPDRVSIVQLFASSALFYDIATNRTVKICGNFEVHKLAFDSIRCFSCSFTLVFKFLF
ncbi:hypothetical protein L9F63_008628, partial [Diploptera punctata]